MEKRSAILVAVLLTGLFGASAVVQMRASRFEGQCRTFGRPVPGMAVETLAFDVTPPTPASTDGNSGTVTTAAPTEHPAPNNAPVATAPVATAHPLSPSFSPTTLSIEPTPAAPSAPALLPGLALGGSPNLQPLTSLDAIKAQLPKWRLFAAGSDVLSRWERSSLGPTPVVFREPAGLLSLE